MPKTVVLSKRMTENIPFLCVSRKYHMPITFALIYSIRFILNLRFTSKSKIRTRICLCVRACAWLCLRLYDMNITYLQKKGRAHTCIYITNTCRPGNGSPGDDPRERACLVRCGQCCIEDSHSWERQSVLLLHTHWKQQAFEKRIHSQTWLFHVT